MKLIFFVHPTFIVVQPLWNIPQHNKNKKNRFHGTGKYIYEGLQEGFHNIFEALEKILKNVKPDNGYRFSYVGIQIQFFHWVYVILHES